MSSYVFTYRQPKEQPLNMEAADEWFKWFDEIGEISARDLDHAVEIAQGCPAIQQGFGLEVGELLEVPAAA